MLQTTRLGAYISAFSQDRLSNPLRVVLLVILLLWCLLPAAQAQEISQWLSSTGTDPTDIRTRLDASIGRVDLLSAGYILELTGSADLAFSRWGRVGLAIPLVYADLASTITTEVGDLKLTGLVSLFQQPQGSIFKALGIGADYFMNTGDTDTGTGFGQSIIAPYITASFYPADGLLVAPLVEEFISVSNDDAEDKRNDISIRIISTYGTDDDIWVTLAPELIIDALGEKKNLYALRTSLGIMLNERTGFSADFVYQLAGERRFENLARINMRYLLPRG